jgi:hypothetical protein
MAANAYFLTRFFDRLGDMLTQTSTDPVARAGYVIGIFLSQVLCFVGLLAAYGGLMSGPAGKYARKAEWMSAGAFIIMVIATVLVTGVAAYRGPN